MATLAAQAIPVTGITPSFAAAAAGLSDAANPNPRQFLRVKNGSGAPINVTLLVPGTLYDQAITDPVIAVPATTGDVSIYLPPEIADPTTGLVSWTYSAVTTVTVALITV